MRRYESPNKMCHHSHITFPCRIFFIRPERDGGHRLILNLKTFNTNEIQLHFKMHSLQSAIDFMTPGAFYTQARSTRFPLPRLIKNTSVSSGTAILFQSFVSQTGCPAAQRHSLSSLNLSILPGASLVISALDILTTVSSLVKVSLFV